MAWPSSPAELSPRLKARPSAAATRIGPLAWLWRRATSRDWRRFTTAASLATIASAFFLAWQLYRFGGIKSTIAFDDIGEAVAAGIAAVSLGLAARRSTGRLRTAWALLAAGAASWTIGEAIWSWYEVFQGVAVPFPSAADAGFLLMIPLAIAGVLVFTTGPTRLATRGEAVLAGAIVALSLLFIAWAVGLRTVYEQSPQSLFATLIGLAYPAGDIVTITVLIIALRRASRPQLGRMLLLMGGLASNAVADSMFTYLTANGTYGAIGSVLDIGWVIGFLMIALAPLWPGPGLDQRADEGPIQLWQLALPWMATLAAAVTILGLAARNQSLDQLLTVLAGTVGVLFVGNQVLTHRDSLDLLRHSRTAESQVQARTALLNQVIVQAPLGIARVGVNLKIIDANPRLGALLHAKPSDIVGSQVGQFLPAKEMERVVQTFQPLWNGVVDNIESDSHALRTDGTDVWLHWSATSIKRPGGLIDFFLVMFEDATAEHAAQEAAMANLAGLERLSQLKSDFVSLVSHEFRTALVGIQGFSEMIRDQELAPGEAKAFAGDINNDAQRLNRMITEMLDLDRIEAGHMTLNLVPLDLNGIVRDSAERARVMSAKHQIVTNLDPALPAVRGDSDRLFQVVSNLLSNAIKYSPGGGEILVTSEVRDGFVQVDVHDHGLGIPPEFVKKLFGRYERFEDKSSKSKIIGTGLGLAITRQIVEMQGGKIWVDSTVGAGSEFHFTVPIDTAGTGVA
ncbi:MAG TPA: PAS domain-containing sensor histidine kinase [Candidatus Dormibacteraeota bacterium]|nr:PAS domain-containing sensor histidine kinase [Candidatus Dormibacteraeota bacterium]